MWCRTVGIVATSMLFGCASITNDAYVPIAFSMSDGSEAECVMTNKRGRWTVEVPDSEMIRRSDDALMYDCETRDGRTATGAIQSTIGAKIVASAVFIDLGITDAITDKHREYPASFVIPIKATQVAESSASPTRNYRSQIRQIQDSMQCNDGARIVETTAESQKWELLCGDGESLEVRCFEDDCYIR